MLGMKNQSFPGVPGLAPNSHRDQLGLAQHPRVQDTNKLCYHSCFSHPGNFSSSSLFKGETSCILCLPELLERENGLKNILSFLGFLGN